MDASPSSSPNYALTVARNSFWNLVNYVVTGVAGVVASIVLTRSLGPDRYGTYSFFISLITIGGLLLDFGLGQAVSKYIPRYFNDPDNKGLAVRVFLRSLAFQAVAALAFITLLAVSYPLWHSALKVGAGDMRLLSMITLASLLPIVASRQTLAFLGATQNFKLVALTNGIVQALYIALIAVCAARGSGLPLVLALQGITNAVSCVILAFLTRPLLGYDTAPKKRLAFSDIRDFSLLAYANTILTFVVWSYSEVFFLGYYSGSREVGFYTLAYSLAAIISTVPGLYLKTTQNVLFELFEKGEESRADRISSMNVKLMSVIFLPLSLAIAFFSRDITHLMYGSAYDKVSVILPLVLFGTIISTTLGSPIIKANTDNKIFGKTILITLAGAGVNLTFDYLFIPKYGSIGAGFANVGSQLILTAVLLTYTFRAMHIAIDWKRVRTVYWVNATLAAVLFGSLTLSVSPLFKIAVIAVAAVAYYRCLIAMKVFDDADADLVEKLAPHAPGLMKPAFVRLGSSMRKSL